MLVGFNARLLSVPTLRGWNRYTVNLLAELPRSGVELVLYSDRPLHEDHLRRLPEGSYRVRVAPPMRYLAWEQRWLPRNGTLDGINLLHTPFNFNLPWSTPWPRVLTLHDAIDQVYTLRLAGWRRRLSLLALKGRFHSWAARTRAHGVITVSEHAKGDLVRYLGIPAEKITVTYEAADPHFHRPIPEEDRARVRLLHCLDRAYVFYVGGWERRKNIPYLVRGFAAAALGGVELVLAGGRDDERADLLALAEALGVADRLRLIGWVAEADLPALYAEALAFVYPSEYEGFGLQLCEAMAIGCPVLAAHATCLPEVLGPGGDTFPLDDVGELAAQLRRLAADPAYRAELSRRGRVRSNDFSWRRTAKETVAVYRRVVAEHGRKS